MCRFTNGIVVSCWKDQFLPFEVVVTGGGSLEVFPGEQIVGEERTCVGRPGGPAHMLNKSESIQFRI